jgi:hypothetical protein
MLPCSQLRLTIVCARVCLCVCVEGAWDKTPGFTPLPDPLADDTPVATAKNMPGDSADLFGDGSAEDGSAANGRLWRTVIIGEQEHRIDLHMIRPYMKVVTHGGAFALGPSPLMSPGSAQRPGFCQGSSVDLGPI